MKIAGRHAPGLERESFSTRRGLAQIEHAERQLTDISTALDEVFAGMHD